MNRTTKTVLQSTLYILWGVVFTWGVIFANNLVYGAVSAQNPGLNPYLNDILSDAVILFVALMPIVWAPKFFGYQIGRIAEHWRMLLGMAVFFVGAPLLYRLVLGETPFGANTWFFEGVVVPLAEEGLMRGILFSILLWGFGKLYKKSTAGWMAILVSTLIFATAHLNNLGSYPTGFILFQVGFSIVLGVALGFARMKSESIYPAIVLHSLFNLGGTL